MTEDLVALFLVIMLLVATVSMTTTGREYMANTKPPTELSQEESLEIVENSLKKAGPSGTYAAFNTQLSKYEDLISKDEGGNEE